MQRTERRTAVAYAPGHLTGIFVPDLRASDPRGRGSRGAGVVLGVGARARVTSDPTAPSSVSVKNLAGAPLPISAEAVRHLTGDRSGAVSVVVEHDLPVGQGFGMSAAGTLAASLAVASLVGASRSRAVEVAHLAELFGGGGLGGVPAILGGGMEVRRVAGVPPWGRVVHTTFPYRVMVGVVGRGLASPRLLRAPRVLARVARAASGLERLGVRPAPDEVLRASERFTDRVALAPPVLTRTIAALRRRGCWAGQAMFGRSFWAVAPTPSARARGLAFLAARNVRVAELSAASLGARPGRRLPGASQAF
jgi:pantoate kinase